MTRLDKINGAIIGLEDLREHFEKVKKKEKKGYFTVSSKWVEEFIDYKIKIYKNIKIKELEKIHKSHNKGKK